MKNTMKGKLPRTKKVDFYDILCELKMMKTAEEKKLIRVFELILVWTLFAALTVCGLITASEKTAYINEGKEIQTVIFAMQNYF